MHTVIELGCERPVY